MFNTCTKFYFMRVIHEYFLSPCHGLVDFALRATPTSGATMTPPARRNYDHSGAKGRKFSVFSQKQWLEKPLLAI
jgi:hypothetical protein